MPIAGIRRLTLPPWPHRLLAAGAAALVLVLAVLAVSPTLHARLHADAGRADHACVITLFQHGATPTLAAMVLVVAPLVHGVRLAAVPSTPRLVPSPHRLPLAHAPPAR